MFESTRGYPTNVQSYQLLKCGRRELIAFFLYNGQPVDILMCYCTLFQQLVTYTDEVFHSRYTCSTTLTYNNLTTLALKRDSRRT